MTVFLERVTELRKERNLTESQVLQACGLNKNLFSNWKKGVVPAYATVTMLAAYFGVNVDYLLGNSDEKAPTANMEGMGFDKGFWDTYSCASAEGDGSDS